MLPSRISAIFSPLPRGPCCLIRKMSRRVGNDHCVGLSARAPSPPAAQAPATQGSPEQNPPPAKAQQEAPTQPSSAPAQAPAAAKTPEGFVLEDGTPVRLRTGRNISSADAHVRDTLDFEVLEDVRVDGVLVIPKGGIAFATVTEAQSKRRMGRGGKLNVNIDSVRLVTHEKAPLRAIKEAKGGGHTGVMTGWDCCDGTAPSSKPPKHMLRQRPRQMDRPLLRNPTVELSWSFLQLPMAPISKLMARSSEAHRHQWESARANTTSWSRKPVSSLGKRK